MVVKIQGARRWRAAVAPRYRIVCAARMCDCESEAEPDAPLIEGNNNTVVIAITTRTDICRSVTDRLQA